MVIRGAGVFLYHANQVLLVHQIASQKWGLPKGSLEANEDFQTCWKRELGEETGIMVLPSYKIKSSKNILRYNITYVEVSSTFSIPIIVPNNEIDNVKWFRISDTKNLSLNAVTMMAMPKDANNGKDASIRKKDPFRSFRSCRLRHHSHPSSYISSRTSSRTRAKKDIWRSFKPKSV